MLVGRLDGREALEVFRPVDEFALTSSAFGADTAYDLEELCADEPGTNTVDEFEFDCADAKRTPRRTIVGHMTRT